MPKNRRACPKLNPFPTAWAELDIEGLGSAIYKIHKAEAIERNDFTEYELGKVIINGRKSLDVVCKEGFLRILEIQPAGKRSMAISDFLNGLRL